MREFLFITLAYFSVVSCLAKSIDIKRVDSENYTRFEMIDGVCFLRVTIHSQKTVNYGGIKIFFKGCSFEQKQTHTMLKRLFDESQFNHELKHEIKWINLGVSHKELIHFLYNQGIMGEKISDNGRAQLEIITVINDIDSLNHIKNSLLDGKFVIEHLDISPKSECPAFEFIQTENDHKVICSFTLGLINHTNYRSVNKT